jgi:hypothetical protein
MKRLTCRIALILILCSFQQSKASSSQSDSGSRFWGYIYSNFELLPELHFDADLTTYFFHKNGYFKQRYFFSNTTNLEFVFISYKWIYSVWHVQFHNGMGQTPGNNVFDPMDVDYCLDPTIEFRIPWCIVSTGIDHHCFHEIDRRDQPTVYYNQGFFEVKSKNSDLFEYWKGLAKEGSPQLNEKFSWDGRTGFYPRSFFGLVAPNKINGINPYTWDIRGEGRYEFYKRQSWFFALKLNSLIGYYKGTSENPVGNGVYWRQDFTLENYFSKGTKGGMMFATYTLDNLPTYINITGTERLPRFSQDRLLKIGVRFFL